MAIYEFELPDGTIVEAEGPDGLSTEEATQMGMQHPEVQRLLNPQPAAPPIPPVVNQQLGGQPGIPVASDEESQVGFGEPLSDAQKRIFGETVGGIGGFAIGGPVGGAAGFAAADQLLDKYLEGKEITPGGAAKSFGEGALYEAIPLGVGKGIKRIIPKDLPKRLMKRAMQFTPKTRPEVADQIVGHALANNLNISRGGLAKASKVAYENAEIVAKRVKDLAAEGKMVDPTEVVAGMRKNLKDPWKDIRLAGSERKAADDFADELYATYKQDFGVDKLNRPQSMSMDAALSEKQALDRVVIDQHVKAQQASSVVAPQKRSAMKSQADSLRNIINQDPAIAAANEEASLMFRWGEQALNRLTKGETSNLLSSQIYMPALLESMYKGGPGIATALGVTRAGTGNPLVISGGANLLNNIKQMGQIIPEGYKSQYLHNMFQEYARGKKASDE